MHDVILLVLQQQWYIEVIRSCINRIMDINSLYGMKSVVHNHCWHLLVQNTQWLQNTAMIG